MKKITLVVEVDAIDTGITRDDIQNALLRSHGVRSFILREANISDI